MQIVMILDKNVSTPSMTRLFHVEKTNSLVAVLLLFRRQTVDGTLLHIVFLDADPGTVFVKPCLPFTTDKLVVVSVPRLHVSVLQVMCKCWRTTFYFTSTAKVLSTLLRINRWWVQFNNFSEQIMHCCRKFRRKWV